MRFPVVFLFAALLAACGAADPEAPPPPPETSAAPVSAAPASVAAPPPSSPADHGAALYAKLCALCHGTDREGYAADNAPSLKSSTFLETATEAFLRDAIVFGRPGTAMAGYGRQVGGPLRPNDVAALVAFLRRDAPPPVALPPESMAGNVANGKVIYDRECASCHGTQTQRGTAVHLANIQLLASAPPGFLRYALVHGRPGTKMEPWGGKLDARAQDDVLAYLRSLAMPVPTAPSGPPPVPPWGPIVINPKGKAPTFDLREGRYASVDQVGKALQAGRKMIIVDARAPSDWLKMHITGSLPLPYYQLDLVDRLPNDGTTVIAYCACPHHASGVVVDELRKRGFKNAYVLDEGVYAWQQKGFPVVAAEGFEKFPSPPHDHHGHDHHGHDHHGHKH